MIPVGYAIGSAVASAILGGVVGGSIGYGAKDSITNVTY